MKTKKPTIGITMGDPSGIGPEVVLKALEKEYKCKPIVFGDLDVLDEISSKLNLDVEFECVDLNNIEISKLELGKVHKEGGKASFEYIKEAVDYALKDKIDAIVTAPINKKALNKAGVPYTGHTEMLADLSGTNLEECLIMFEVENLRTFFLTRHVPLKRVSDLITKEKIVNALKRIDKFLSEITPNPLIAVAGLNPHAGEEGLFGDEEEEIIKPAVRRAKEKGINAKGPLPADSVYHQTLEGKYEAVLSLYHDQGHIATKTYDFKRTVSVQWGLPFLRTSVDHGTAFDIAGKGIADSTSLEEAIKVALKYL